MGLRILHLDAGRDWRGGQRQVFLLARAQREAGHEPLVVAHPEAPLIKRLRGAGLAAAAVRMRADWDLAAARRVRTLLTKWRADVVHAHDARSHAIALAALVARRAVPLIVTRRVANRPRGRLKYGERVARFIAISHAVRETLTAGGVDPARIDVVYSGVPIPVVREPRDWRAECGWNQESVVCGVVGAMTSEKGIHLLERIGRQLTPEARHRARLVLLGGKGSGTDTVGGVPTYRAGFVDAIYEAMAGLDVLWHPSSAEGLGTAVIDAMSLGVPPVAFAVGGLPELIVHEQSGLLVAAGDVQLFAKEASRVVSDPRLHALLAAAGPARAKEFTVERMADGAERTYRRALKATRRVARG